MAQALACLRYLLIGGTVLLGISGIVVAIFGGFFLYQLHEYAQLTPENVCGSSVVLVATGLVTCFLGWCAWQFLDFVNKGQVIVFVTILSIISLVETSAGIWALVRHEQIDTLPSNHLSKTFGLGIKHDKELWDRMQSKFRCCGIHGPSDYRGFDSVPWSCCDVIPSSSATDNKGICTSIHSRGCHSMIITRTRSILLHVFLLGLCSVLLQICLIVSTTCYTRAYADKLERRTQALMISQMASPDRDNMSDRKLLDSQAISVINRQEGRRCKLRG